VILSKEDAARYLQPFEIERIVRTYSDHILFPIELVDEKGEARQINADSGPHSRSWRCDRNWGASRGVQFPKSLSARSAENPMGARAEMGRNDMRRRCASTRLCGDRSEPRIRIPRLPQRGSVDVWRP